MGMECRECEHDLRSGHARSCSRWKPERYACLERDLLEEDGLEGSEGWEIVVTAKDHEAALAADRKIINDALVASNEAGFAFMSPAEVIRHQAQENVEFKQQLDTLKLALQVECEKNAAKDARIAEFERWCSALMPHLEHLLDRSPSEFGIDGDGEDCWPLLAEFVMTGCVLLEEGK